MAIHVQGFVPLCNGLLNRATTASLLLGNKNQTTASFSCEDHCTNSKASAFSRQGHVLHHNPILVLSHHHTSIAVTINFNSVTSPAYCCDPEGDLRLIVGGDWVAKPLQVIACSKELSQASPVLETIIRRSLQGFHGPAKYGRHCTIELPDDDPARMLVLLNFIHDRPHLVPVALTLDQLYDILVICDKYLMIHIIKPWARSWYWSHRLALARDRHGIPGKEVLLWITWQLGLASQFVAILFIILFNNVANAAGQLLDSMGLPLEDYDVSELSSILCKWF